MVGLEEKRFVRVLKLSGGQQRRLDVAVALVGNPELLFLDEPTTGFDPSARRDAWDVIKNLATVGMTVLLTTHYRPRRREQSTRGSFTGRRAVPDPRLGQITAAERGGRALGDDPASHDHGDPVGEELRLVPDGYTEITPDDVVEAMHQLTGWAIDHGSTLDGLALTRLSLEDIYLSLVATPPGDTGRRAAPSEKRKGHGG